MDDEQHPAAPGGPGEQPAASQPADADAATVVTPAPADAPVSEPASAADSTGAPAALAEAPEDSAPTPAPGDPAPESKATPTPPAPAPAGLPRTPVFPRAAQTQPLPAPAPAPTAAPAAAAPAPAVHAQPAPPQPGFPQAQPAQSGYPQPAYPQTAYPQPGFAQPGFAPAGPAQPPLLSQSPAAPKPPRKPLRGRVVVAAGAVASVLVGAIVGGVVVANRDSSRNSTVAAYKAAQNVQQTPLSGGVRSDGSHYGSLFSFLLPLPDGYTLGPDFLDYGDNSFISEQQFSADVNDLFYDLPKSDMTSITGDLTSQHLVGVAVRSMHNGAGTLTVSFVLSQLDAKSAQDEANQYISTFTGLNIFRTGAAVPGYPAAKCLLPPGLGNDKVDDMQCVAVSGDVEVMVFAQGTAPLDQGTVVQLMAQQLGRLKSAQTIG